MYNMNGSGPRTGPCDTADATGIATIDEQSLVLASKERFN